MRGARGKAVGGDSQGRDTGATALRVHTLRAIGEAEPAAWNACANPISDSSSEIRQATPPATKAGEAGAPQPLRHLKRPMKNLFSIHSYRTLFYRRSRTPARLAAGRDGKHSISWSKLRRDRCLAQRPATSRAILAASTCSIAAGPRPTNARAAAITRNSRSRCRSRLPLGGGSWCDQDPTPILPARDLPQA